ncbi:MAG: hypothetical protein SH857_00525 [Chitinophagales bacterium]|nr:hypothetical protein [Chitinophagales bacterium]
MSSAEMNPAIVVSAYNREQSLLRLLLSLEQAEYPARAVTLIISIDKNENKAVAQAAEDFRWSHGEKRIIQHQQHLGLRGHILTCGDLTKEYGSIILFEDDLFASKYFYSFATNALNFYEEEKQVAGISLYSYDISEIGFNPFAAVNDGNDVYFMQVASSWGQAWTSEQWQGFRIWFQQNPDLNEKEQPPVYLLKWSENSWKKHFIRYLHFTGKYFVFPRFSFSTNFEEPGATASTKGLYQVAIQQGRRDCRLSELEQSHSVYDAYFEMTAACLKKWNQQLNSFDFTTDIYGNHPVGFCKTSYLLTTKEAKNAALSFGLEMFPPVLNVINSVNGDAIKMVKREDVLSEKVPNDLSYYKYKTVSEIIFQDELIECIEQVHAVNSEKVKELHHDYTSRMEGLSEQVRTLHKDYHAQITQLHSEYEVKVKDTVEQALKDYQFKIDHPAFTIITIAKRENIEAALQTARSVQQQDYPRFRHQLILIGNADGVNLSEFASSSFSFQSVHEIGEALCVAEEQLNDAESDFHCWLEAGTVLLPKAMMTVRDIFKRFAEVNWLKGLPAQLGSKGEIIPVTNGIDYRWDKNRFHAGTLAEIGNKISCSGIFWKRHLWQNEGGKFNHNFSHLAEIELFNRMFERDMLHVVLAHLASSGKQTYSPSPAAEAEFATLQKSFPQRSAFQEMVSAASYPFFKRDIPFLRAVHKSRSTYPPLIRFDYQTQSFYLSEY